MDAPPIHVVVVNDDSAFLELMRELLEDEGFEATCLTTTDTAYQEIKRLQPGLVVLDIVMNGEERGWQVLELLTLDPGTRPIPVIVCSAALPSLQQRELVLKQHGIRSLPKPFDLEDLLREMRGALAERA
jgi:CheY-like chemotaxis protein